MNYDLELEEGLEEFNHAVVQKEVFPEEEEGRLTLKNLVLFPALEKYSVRPSQIPEGITKTDFKWVLPLTQEKFDMEFLSGFLGFSQAKKDFTIRPEVGWVVKEK